MEENKVTFKKYFYEEYSIIKEAKAGQMGHFTEIIFAIGLLHYTLKHLVTSEDIMGTINDIPSLPYNNIFNHDNYDVALDLAGVKTAQDLIGGNFNSLKLEEQKVVKEVINRVAVNIPKLKTIHKVDSFIEKSKKLPEANKFVIVIKSSGASTTQQRDTKADVSMELIAKENIKVPSDLKKIVYSVKYSSSRDSSSKVTEGSLFNVLLRLGNAFKLPMTRGLENLRHLPYAVGMGQGPKAGKWEEFFYENPEYKKLSEQKNHLLYFIRQISSTQKDPSYINEVTEQFKTEFSNETVVKEKQQPVFSNTLYDFLEKEIFGQDMADIVHINAKGVHDIDLEAYNKIRNTSLVDFSAAPSESQKLILKFDAISKEGSRFVLFWIDNHQGTSAQINVGADLLK